MTWWVECSIIFGTIHRVSFDNAHNGSEVETTVAGLRRPEQIAIDWINCKLYFTDHVLRLIVRSNLDGTNIEIVVNLNVIPQSIAVDPIHGTLFIMHQEELRKWKCLDFYGEQ